MPTGSLTPIYNDGILTTNPEITFFKQVYRQYTNFASESTEILIQDADFNKRITIQIPKNGDLINHIYLKIQLPPIKLINNDLYTDSTAIANLQTAINNESAKYTEYKTFFRYNFIILNSLNLEIKSIGSNWFTVSELMATKLLQYGDVINAINVGLDNVLSEFALTFPLSVRDNYIGSQENETKFINDVSAFISRMKNYYKEEDLKLITTINNMKTGLNNISTKNEYFAWVKKIGFYIIKQLSVLVGGTEICRYTGESLDIFYELNNTFFHVDTLNQMIGNVSNLTTYTNDQINGVSLYIPIPVWCGKHSGNSFPLISLVYSEFEIEVEFNDVNDCCFYNGDLNLSNIIHIQQCNLLVDYVYLDMDERNLMARFSHEYIIEGIKDIETTNININQYSVNLDIEYPTKELYWVVKENTLAKQYKLFSDFSAVQIYEISSYSAVNNDTKITFYGDADDDIFAVGKTINVLYSKYYDGEYEIKSYLKTLISGNYKIDITIRMKYVAYTNYYDGFFGIICNNSLANPLELEYITYNDAIRTPKIDTLYYNYVVPWKHYLRTPKDGINAFSFCLKPAEWQPNGSSNLSAIRSKRLNLVLNNSYYRYLVNKGLVYDIVIYGMTYNILRITHGTGGLVFAS